MYSHLLIRLLAIVFLATVASCRGLHGLPDKSGETYAVTLYYKAQQGVKPAPVIEQANVVKTALRGKLKLKTAAGISELKYKSLDSFSVGSVKYLVIPDSIVYPHRAVAPFYKVERLLTDSTVLLSNRSAYDRNYGSTTTSLSIIGATATSMYVVNNNAPINASTIGIAALGAGAAYSLTDFLFREVLVWPTEQFYFEYNRRTRAIRMLRDSRAASLLKK